MAFWQNAREKLANALLGTPAPVEGVTPGRGYGEDIDNYLNTLGEQDYMKPLLNQPKETGLTLDQYKEGVANGLNYGVPQIAQAQQQLGINIPKTGEEIEQAQLGEFNKPGLITGGAATAPRQGGFIGDFGSGFTENYNEGFNPNNWGGRKGWGTRLGELAGSLARFYDKPIGRALAATGLSYLTGEVNPLNEGITAYTGRQGNMTADKLYRNQLRQMGMSEEDLNAIPGNITKDLFNGVTNAMRYNNQRITWGDLAKISPEIAAEIEANPELADQFIPVNIARDIYGLKRDTAKGKMEEIKAKIEKTQAETKQVGKPKVNINIKQGGTTSRIVHESGSPKPTKPERPTQTTGSGRVRVGNQQYTQEEIQKELKRRGLI